MLPHNDGFFNTQPISLSGPRVFGNAQWGKDWVKVSSELAQDRKALSASVRDAVNSIGDASKPIPPLMAIWRSFKNELLNSVDFMGFQTGNLAS